MGCDIHAYMEYRKAPGRWHSFGERVNPGRNYTLFARLNGVRGEGEPVAPERGFPEDAGFYALDDNTLFVTEDGDGERYCTLEDARRWTKNPLVKIHDRIPDPDWHSHSWVTPDELEKALNADDVKARGDEPEYKAILAALRSFEKDGYDARLVFWFDN
jgi:hypothetical protein